MEIRQVPVKNFTKGRSGFKPRAVVLHITEGSSSSALGKVDERLGWFSDARSFASSHYLITERGEILQLVSERDTAWHCGRVVNPRWKGIIEGENPNQYTIGVEVATPNSKFMPPWKQWTATARLVKWICERYSFPLDELHVVNHNEIRQNKSCPGFFIRRFYIIILMKFI